MKLSELIADEVTNSFYAHEGEFPNQLEHKTAAAITARLNECVKPLEWEGFCSGPYKIEVEKGGIANLYFYGNAADHEEDGPELMQGGYLTLVSLDDLKAAAQAHYAKHLIEGLNL